ncbi:MAG: DUF2865 domain-containing protein [Hyphomicrobiaceae bacterium]|nr:DUF2865 domain-containing protein [Hyphomicrobiaceae bacterium]
MPVLAQGFSWPWDNERPKPIPREPARQAPAPLPNGAATGGWQERDSSSNSVCLNLEQRLVQESQRGSQSREVLPRIEADIRQLERTVRSLDAKLERSDCYEWFLFSKQLRNSRKCRDLSRDVEDNKRKLAGLEAERQQIQSSSGQSYQDEIIRALARNGCGSSYQEEARRRDSSPFSGLWQDEDSGGSGGGARYNALPFATYRTVCVRLCDGYYFPVSFSTLPNHFQRDSEVCQSKCAAPAQLYYYQNPGGAVDQMVAVDNNELYTKLKTAFLYRKEYVQGCSCKQAEYLPKSTMPGAKQAQNFGTQSIPGQALPSVGAADQDQRRSGPAAPARGKPQIGDALDPWRPR